MMRILDLARWAPSGDNTQPWRFEIVSGDHVVVHGFDTRENCVYDLDGRASRLAIGALLETLRIAATGHGLRAEVTQRRSCPEIRPTFDVRLIRDNSVSPSDLVPCITLRSVQRRPLRTRSLTSEQKSKLQASAGNNHKIVWLEGWSGRLAMARLTWSSAKIRLTIREAYEVHRRIIEWGARYSEDRVPDQAIGLDPIAMRLSRWMMNDWRRVELMNTFFGGTLYPRLELDLIPALSCGAHFVLLADAAVEGLARDLGAGAAVQRVWLTATRLGLQMQPEMTPLIFARYSREARTFTSLPSAAPRARGLEQRLARWIGAEQAPRADWMARIGVGQPASARSVRLPLDSLLI